MSQYLKKFYNYVLALQNSLMFSIELILDICTKDISKEEINRRTKTITRYLPGEFIYFAGKDMNEKITDFINKN